MGVSHTLLLKSSILRIRVSRHRPRIRPSWRQLTTQGTKPKQHYFVTTPIFYVNSVPHIGHLHSAVLADAIKRYNSLLGKDVKLSTGTDEHGLKIQQAAEKAGVPTYDFCTTYSEKFKDLFRKADVSYTDFIRTTERRHYESVSHFWSTLRDKGYIYKGEHCGWYAVSDEAFYTESQVEERVNPVTGRKEMVAIESGQPVEWTAEENYKFRLGEFKEKLIDWINSNPQVIYPSVRKNEVLSWLHGDVPDLSISRPRSRLGWGIPVPGDVDHTIYVWLDALVNYATVDGYPELSTKYFPADVHVVGKDILRFHAVYWPAFLMAAGLPLPARILAHAHWTMENMKMSKSRGNVADPFQAIDRFGVDPVRYYLLRNGGLADDGDYSDQAVAIHYKKDLAGQLGNLASRCMAKKMSPQLSRFAEIGERERTRGEEHNIDPRDAALRKALTSLQARTGGYFDQQEFGKGISHIFESVSLANKYISDNEPWQLVRAATGGDAAAKERLQVVLFYALETARIAGVLLQPIIPTKSTELLDVLGVSADERRWHNSEFGTGWTTTQSGAVAAASVKPLFPRIE